MNDLVVAFGGAVGASVRAFFAGFYLTRLIST